MIDSWTLKLLSALVLFWCPSLLVFLRSKNSSRHSLWAFGLISASVLLQLIYNVANIMDGYALESAKFGIFGLLLCISGPIVGFYSPWKIGRLVYIVTGTFTFVCWIYIMSLH